MEATGEYFTVFRVVWAGLSVPDIPTVINKIARITHKISGGNFLIPGDRVFRMEHIFILMDG